MLPIISQRAIDKPCALVQGEFQIGRVDFDIFTMPLHRSSVAIEHYLVLLRLKGLHRSLIQSAHQVTIASYLHNLALGYLRRTGGSGGRPSAVGF